MKRLGILAALLFTLALLPTTTLWAQSETSVTGAAGGIFPPGTTFNAIPISALKTGIGVVIASDGSAIGQFECLLAGVSALGQPQNISVNGRVTAGAHTAANAATFSGTCTLDMGDGTPPTPSVPFTVTVTTNASGQGTLGLALSVTTLPNSTINAGSITIK